MYLYGKEIVIFENNIRPLPKTRAAIEAYDILYDQFNSSLQISHRRWIEFVSEIERLAEAVGIAYGEETCDINNPETCKQCIRPGPKVLPPGAELSFVRRMVNDWEKKNGM